MRSLSLAEIASLAARGMLAGLSPDADAFRGDWERLTLRSSFHFMRQLLVTVTTTSSFPGAKPGATFGSGMENSQVPEAVTITPALLEQHGLTPDEYALIFKALGRVPSLTELGIYSVMWSEHCSYKSSKGAFETPADQERARGSGSGRKRGHY